MPLRVLGSLVSSDLDYFCEWCETWYVVRVLAQDCRTHHLESNVIDPRDDCESSGGVAHSVEE
jgi:hypothetical protein